MVNTGSGLNKYEVLKERISAENVLRMSELIALKSLKSYISWYGTKMVPKYKVLYKDIIHLGMNDMDYTVSDQYELVQEVACFLWQHEGKYLNDIYAYGKNGKVITIERECFHMLNKIMYYKPKPMKSFENLIREEEPYTEDISTEQDYSEADEILEKMNLSQTLLDTLNCFMQGMTYPQIVEELSIAFATVWRRRIKLQQIYMSVIN